MLSVTKNIFGSNLFFLSKTSRFKNVRSIAVSGIEAPDDTLKVALTIKSTKEIPGPSTLPFIGPLHHFLPGGAFYKMNRVELGDELYKLYGPIVRIDKVANRTPLMIFLYDAEEVSKVLRGEETAPRRPPMELLELYKQECNTKHSKFTSDIINDWGPTWKKARDPANKFMLDPKIISSSYSESLDEVAKEAVQRFQSVRNENDMIPDLVKELNLWALESTAVITLGRRLNCFSNDLPGNSPEKQLITLIPKIFDILEADDFDYNLMKLISIGQRKTALNILIELERLVNYLAANSMRNLELNKVSKELEKSTLVNIMTKNKDAAKGMATVSMIAGVDSVSQTVLILLYLLGTNLKKQEKLRQYLMSGSDGKKYLRACMKESSRIIPSVSAVPRITSKSYEIFGYEIPKGAMVVCSHHTMCAMEKNYLRAREFIPERWLVEKEHPLYYGNAPALAHNPFGFGIRSCIGRRLAELMMEALLTQMIRKFEIKWVGPPPKIIPKTVNKLEGPHRFVLKNI